MKLLTVAVPCYNVEPYLDVCLSSMADARFADTLEVLVVNDGSTDRTAEIAAGYAARFPSVFRVIDKKNGGHGSAVNAGMAHAAGKYFRVVDGDDWVNTENLARLLDSLARTDTDLVIDEKTTVDLATRRETFFPYAVKPPLDAPLPFSDFCGAEYADSYMLHTLTVRLSLLREHGVRLREHVLYVDYEYVVKATAFAESVTFLDLDVYRYLIGNAAQSVDSQNYVKRYGHHLLVLKEVLRFVDSLPEGLDPRKREYLFLKACLMIHTNLNICLIFNKNRREGRRQAIDLRRFLRADYPAYYRATAKRYAAARTLHAARVDFDGLQKLMGRA